MASLIPNTMPEELSCRITKIPIEDLHPHVEKPRHVKPFANSTPQFDYAAEYEARVF